MKKAFLACLTCLGVLFACTPEEGGSVSGGLTVDVDKIEATTDGGEFNVKVTCGVATTTTITYLEGGENWITLMPKVLKGNGTLKFTLGKYLEYDATRTATATIEGTGVKQVINISQTGRPAPVATELDLDKYNVYADVKGGEFTVAVSAGAAWTATSDATWCTVQNGSATGIGEFKIVVPKSEDYQYRTAKVTVTSGSLTREVVVEHVGTKIGNVVWANANVNEPDTFCESCDELGKLYQWNTKNGYASYTLQSTTDTGCCPTLTSANANPEDAAFYPLTPGYEGGEADAGAMSWEEEKNPCPDGWVVPTQEQVMALIGQEENNANKFFVDYWKLKGPRVSGAFCGIDRELVAADDFSIDNRQGTIFIPIAGVISAGKGAPDLAGKQREWWNAAIWTNTNCGHSWDFKALWMCADTHMFGWADMPSRTGLSVRCVLAN